MKRFKQIMLLLMTVSLVTLTGCSSDDDTVVIPPGGGAEFLTARIDGADFTAAQSPAVIVGATSTNGILTVQGGKNDGSTINFAIMGYTGVGIYTSGDNLSNTNFIQYLEITPAVATWASSGVTSIVGGLTPGSIEITSDDGTTVEGTFSFEGYNAGDMTLKVITEGAFKANLE